MRFILVLAVLVLSGCATRSIPMEPSVYLLSTDREPRALLEDIAEEMKKSRYEVESLDLNIGLMVMEPRRFVIVRGEQRTYGEQVFTIRQEGGSVRVRITYTCEYAAQGTVPCDINDKFASDKIKRIERLILAMVNRKLFKKAGETNVEAKEI